MMKVKVLRYLAFMACFLGVLLAATPDATAQRRVTPVEPAPAKPVNPAQQNEKEADRTHVVERQDAAGNVVLVDTLTGKEWVDSAAIRKVPKMIFPLIDGVSIGVNIWDPVMRLLGQHYGLIDFWGELSMHNRYKPVFEFGLGVCNDTPDGMNYTYKSKMAPYFKIGANYNVFYNSNPDYQLLVGARYGISFFSFEVTDITSPDDYWGPQPSYSIPLQNCTAGYFELCAGIKVKIVKNISLGWQVKYHSLLHGGSTSAGEAMYIPGFGKRGSAITGSFSVIYTLPLNRSPRKTVNTEGDDS